MKSLLLTALLSTGVAHTGAFLEVWSLPYVEDHFTLDDVGRKIERVTKWNETANSLREHRTEVAEENLAMYDEPVVGERDPVVEAVQYQAPKRVERKKMRTRSRTVR